MPYKNGMGKKSCIPMTFKYWIHYSKNGGSNTGQTLQITDYMVPIPPFHMEQ